MAGLQVFLPIRTEGLDLCEQSIESIAEACANAGRDDTLVLESISPGLYWNGQQIARIAWPRMVDGQILVRVVPAIGIVPLVAWVQSFIAAQVEWQDGWPMLTTQPRDDRDEDPEPIDLTPYMLEPVS